MHALAPALSLEDPLPPGLKPPRELPLVQAPARPTVAAPPTEQPPVAPNAAWRGGLVVDPGRELDALFPGTDLAAWPAPLARPRRLDPDIAYTFNDTGGLLGAAPAGGAPAALAAPAADLGAAPLSRAALDGGLTDSLAALSVATDPAAPVGTAAQTESPGRSAALAPAAVVAWWRTAGSQPLADLVASAPASARPRRLPPAAVPPAGPPRPVPPRRVSPLSVDPLWVLDANDALVLTPGVIEHEFSQAAADLRAQVSGGTVATYSWNLSGAPDATNVTGLGTYRLQLTWAAFTGAARTNTIVLTTTNTDLTRQSQTLTYSVTGTDSPAWGAGPTSYATWPAVVTPDWMTGRQETFAGPYYRAGLAEGDVQTSHDLPTYNPGVPAVTLLYSSTAADRLPIFLVRYALSPAQAIVPTRVSARLKLNNVFGSEVYYNTALLNPGGVLQIALQATAAQTSAAGDGGALPSGRYPYEITVTAHHAPPVTTTHTGQVTLLDSSRGPLGIGWSLHGLQRLWPAAGGLVLELPGGRSLWFDDGPTGLTYDTPAGDFSTLVRNDPPPDAGKVYTRRLKDGTKVHFDALGRQNAEVDRNGNTFTYAWTAADASGKLSTLTDPNGLVTTFAYTDAGHPTRIHTITDPALRVTTLGYNAAGELTAITDPDPDAPGSGLPAPVTGYLYDTAHRLTTLTSPRSFPTTFAYDFAGRLETVQRPDATTEGLTPLQLRGLAAPGTGTSPANPAPPMLAVEARAAYTDGDTNVWFSRLDWLGFGQGAQREEPNGTGVAMGVSHRGANGLAWMTADPLGRRTRSWFDPRANPLQVVHPDDAFDEYSYDAFSLVDTHKEPDPDGAGPLERPVTVYTRNPANGNLDRLTRPDPDGTLGPLTSSVIDYTYRSDGLLETETDPRGNVTAYAYDPRDRLTTITYADGDGNPGTTPRVLLGYDAAGNLTRREDQRQHVTSYVYDNLNRRTEMTLPDGDGDPGNNPKYTYGYDASGNRTTVTDPLQHTTTTAFDPMERPWTVTDPLLHVTTNAYDGVGNLQRVTAPDPDGPSGSGTSSVTTYVYDSVNNLAGVINGEGESVGYGRDVAHQRLSMTDHLGHTTSYTYHARGWLASVEDPLHNRLEYTYTRGGDRLTAAEVEYATGTRRTVTYTHDALHRQTEARDALDHVTTYGYDAADNLVKVTAPDPDGPGPLLSPVTTLGYNARNWQTTRLDPLGHTTTLGYDEAGNRTTVTDPLSRVTTYQFDAQDRVDKVTQPDPDDGGPLTVPETRYRIDLAGRLESLTDPVDNVTTYGYDNADRLVTVRDPSNKVTTYGYDDADRLTSAIDRLGRIRLFVYDQADRRTAEAWHDGINFIRIFVYVYDDAGRLIFAGDPDSAYGYGYDNADRVTGIGNDIGPSATPLNDFILTQDFDGFNDRQYLADQAGGRIDFRYDAAHRMERAFLRVSTGVGPQVTLGYDNLDRLTGMTRWPSATLGGGPGANPSLTSTLAYDAASRTTSIAHGHSSAGSLAVYSYTAYTDADELASYTGPAPEGTLNYQYDQLGQLTTVTGARAETYTYDKNGNRKTANGVSYGNPGPGNRLTTVGADTYTYDHKGNIKTKVSGTQQIDYTWDYRNRLTEVVVKDAGATVVHDRFTYDVNDRRIGRSVNGVQEWTIYDGDNPFIDFNAGGAPIRRYLYGPAVDFLLARLVSPGDTAWYLSDRLGSVRPALST